MIDRGFRRWLTLAATLLLMLVTGCGGGGGEQADGEPVTIRAGWVQVLQWTHFADVPTHLQVDNVRFELTPFKTSNEVLVGLTSGSLDVGTIGFNHAAGALARGPMPLEFIAGVSSGGSRFVAAEGADIASWEDLQGKRLGSARGSTQYIQLATAMKKHGMDIDTDTQFTNLAGAPDMNVALQNGDVDAIMSWEPNASEAIEKGYGVNVDEIQGSLYGDSFKISSGIAARKEFVEQQPQAISAFMDAYHDSWQKITNDRDYWVKTFADLTGAEPAVLEAAADNAFPDFGIDQQQVATMADLLAEQGEIDHNVTADLVASLNYDFLSEAAAKSPEELGKSP